MRARLDGVLIFCTATRYIDEDNQSELYQESSNNRDGKSD